MILIGSGSLLRRTLVIAKDNSLTVDLVCTNRDEGLFDFCKRLNIPVLVTRDLNTDLLPEIGRSSDGVAVSVNNSAIIRDELLSTDVSFFNVHNGLVQKYRGIAEVCVLAAICNLESEYGSTLHRLLPSQEVDSGPVLQQRAFTVDSDENFERVFTKSINNYMKLIMEELPNLVSLIDSSGQYLHGPEVYLYKDVSSLLLNASNERRHLACNLGKYSGLLPRLSRMINEI